MVERPRPVAASTVGRRANRRGGALPGDDTGTMADFIGTIESGCLYQL
jgi:hypothetical protein